MQKVYHVTQLPLFVCLQCNHFFEVKKEDIRRLGSYQPKFCNKKCWYAYLSENFKKKDRCNLDKETLFHLYVEEGKSMDEVAKHLGVATATVYDYLTYHGIPRRKRGEHLLTDKNPLRGKSFTEEHREKLRDSRSKHFSNPENRAAVAHRQCQVIAEGKYKASSKLEDKVAVALSQLGFAFIRQYPIHDPEKKRYGACVDFKLSDGRVIEVNGTFWHADPRVYPDGPIHETQKHTVENYQRKLALLHSLHIPVIELWEKDLNHDMIEAIKQALM